MFSIETDLPPGESVLRTASGIGVFRLIKLSTAYFSFGTAMAMAPPTRPTPIIEIVTISIKYSSSLAKATMFAGEIFRIGAYCEGIVPESRVYLGAVDPFLQVVKIFRMHIAQIVIAPGF
jgi:hypothetical protein